MQEVIKWGQSGTPIRQAVVQLCGWESRKGTITATGRRIACTEWGQLSPAARNVLAQHGISE